MKHSKGYVLVIDRNHPKSGSRGRMMEHRIIFEEYYKCCLLDWGIVHHRNGDKTDNRIENMEGMTTQQHTRLHNPRHIIDIENRRCYECGRKTRYVKSKRSGELLPHWYNGEKQNTYKCHRCYNKRYRKYGKAL